MTNDDRLAAARAALAAAEQAAASGEGFLSEQRARAERTEQVQRDARSAAAAAARREERRAERAARRTAAKGETGRSSGAAGSDLFAPERAAAASRVQADRGRRGMPSDPGSAEASVEQNDSRAGALDSGQIEPRRTRTGRPSPFDAPDGSTGEVPDAYEVARQIVLRQLAMAPRSRAQLLTKLADRGCPPQVAASVVDRMEQVGLVDDEEYAVMLVRTQVAARGLSRRGLAYELRKKGIDADLAEQALEQVDSEEERETARALVEKKLRSMSGLQREVATRRLAGMLARKGYGPGLAYAVVREALDERPEFRRD